MNKQIRTLFWLSALMFGLLLTSLTYRQLFSSKLRDHPGNHRQLLTEYSIHRGSIFSADGQVLAESVNKRGVFQRRYPQGETFAAITGYWNPDRGRSGIEQSYNFWLLGQESYADFADWFSALLNRHNRGNDLTLTVNSKVQKAAWEALGDKKGAVVALDPKTGAVLALVSKPGYNPNLIERDWRRISTNADSPLLNRAVQGLYPPGSTFKIITAAAGLDAGVVEADTVFNGPPVLKVDGGTVRNFADEAGGRQSVAQAFIHSTNTIFAQIGLKIGAQTLIAQAEKFGFNHHLDFTLPTKTSRLAAANMDSVLLAWTAVGQGETVVTPLQMAVVAAAVAEGGRVPKPYLVKTVRDYKGRVISRGQPTWNGRAMKRETAALIKSMMIKVVSRGTGRGIWTPDYDIAGKTGSAETGKGADTDAWFVAFAPADNPQIVVAVIVENGGLGGKTAAPIAKEVIGSMPGLQF